jgi:hypothetical protein
VICGIKACAVRKGYEFCNECSEYGTCALMRKFVEDTKWPYQQGVLKNMEMIRCDGLAKWLEVQDERWRCANCDTSYSWWDETCPQCSQAVANYQADVFGFVAAKSTVHPIPALPCK